jgi:hypothetical protein
VNIIVNTFIDFFVFVYASGGQGGRAWRLALCALPQQKLFINFPFSAFFVKSI